MKEQKRGRDFDRMIVEAVQGNFSFFAWQSHDGVVEKCEMKVRAFRKDYNEIELEVKEDQLDKLPKNCYWKSHHQHLCTGIIGIILNRSKKCLRWKDCKTCASTRLFFL